VDTDWIERAAADIGPDVHARFAELRQDSIREHATTRPAGSGHRL
jgi:hypothetical protein